MVNLGSVLVWLINFFSENPKVESDIIVGSGVSKLTIWLTNGDVVRSPATEVKITPMGEVHMKVSGVWKPLAGVSYLELEKPQQ
jgi:hypothetical protein